MAERCELAALRLEPVDEQLDGGRDALDDSEVAGGRRAAGLARRREVAVRPAAGRAAELELEVATEPARQQVELGGRAAARAHGALSSLTNGAAGGPRM